MRYAVHVLLQDWRSRCVLRCGPAMEMPGLLAMVRLRRGSDLYVVVEEDHQHRTVDLMSITGKEHLMRGVPLGVIGEVVKGPPTEH